MGADFCCCIWACYCLFHFFFCVEHATDSCDGFTMSHFPASRITLVTTLGNVVLFDYPVYTFVVVA